MYRVGEKERVLEALKTEYRPVLLKLIVFAAFSEREIAACIPERGEVTITVGSERKITKPIECGSRKNEVIYVHSHSRTISFSKSDLVIAYNLRDILRAFVVFTVNPYAEEQGIKIEGKILIPPEKGSYLEEKIIRETRGLMFMEKRSTIAEIMRRQGNIGRFSYTPDISEEEYNEILRELQEENIIEYTTK